MQGIGAAAEAYIGEILLEKSPNYRLNLNSSDSSVRLGQAKREIVHGYRAGTGFADDRNRHFGGDFYLGSYAALQFGLIHGRGYLYPALNALAAGLVAVSLIEAYNLSSLLIQISWILISAYGIARIYFHRNIVRYTAEEEDFLKRMLPELPKEHAKAFFKLAHWHDGLPGDVLTLEDKPVDHLVYLHDGCAIASLNNEKLGIVAGHHFIGEVTCLRGGPATATMTLAKPSRLMRIEAARLKQFLNSNPTVREHLERCFNQQMGAETWRHHQALTGFEIGPAR